MTSPEPRLVSSALSGMPPPDFADVQIVPLRGAPAASAAEWVGRIFDRRSIPPWVGALFAVRAAVVPLIGLRQSRERAAHPFAVSEVHGEEALVVTDAPHLLFRLGVAADEEAGLLRATTAVWFHGWRGRAYFVPVGVLHGPVLRSMMLRAVRRGGGASVPPARDGGISRTARSLPK